MRKKLLFTLLLLAGASVASAQRLEYELDFKVRFDNREYKSEYVDSKTLFGLKLAPELGLSWGNSGRHRLMGGVDVTRHFGSKEQFQPNPGLILYYNYDNKKNLNAYAGIFQRSKLSGRYPRSMFTSTTVFYDPLLEGVLLNYHGEAGYIEAACDWNGMMTSSTYERFVIYSSGWLNLHRRVGFTYNMMMHHFAGSKEDRGVVDNIMFNPMATFNFSLEKSETLRSSLRAGWLQTFQRDRRNENKFVYPNGFAAEVNLVWKSLGVSDYLFVGDDIMPFYDRYGSALYPGDEFYTTRHDWYNRLELFWKPRIGDGVELTVCAIHHYDGKKSNWQQLISLSIQLDRNRISKPGRK